MNPLYQARAANIAKYTNQDIRDQIQLLEAKIALLHIQYITEDLDGQSYFYSGAYASKRIQTRDIKERIARREQEKRYVIAELQRITKDWDAAMFARLEQLVIPGAQPLIHDREDDAFARSWRKMMVESGLVPAA